MKRSIHIPALTALVVVSTILGAVLWWLWSQSMATPEAIRCNHGGHSVFACDTNFGNYATVVVLLFAPLIGWLTHKAFFTEFKRGNSSAA